MSCKIFARISTQSKKVSIDSSFITSEEKIFHEIAFIYGRTSFMPKLVFGLQNVPEVNEIGSLNPTLFIMLCIHIPHVVDSVHIVRRRDIAVHYVMS